MCVWGASQVALVVKKLPADSGDIIDPGVPSLSLEDRLKEGMAICSNTLGWRIRWPEEPGSLWSTESEMDTTKVT